MKVKFTKDRDTLKYGKVSKGDIKTVSTKEGKAFIANGIAKIVKGVKEDG